VKAHSRRTITEQIDKRFQFPSKSEWPGMAADAL